MHKCFSVQTERHDERARESEKSLLHPPANTVPACATPRLAAQKTPDSRHPISPSERREPADSDSASRLSSNDTCALLPFTFPPTKPAR